MYSQLFFVFFRNQYRWWWYTLIFIYQTLQKYQKQNKSHQYNTIHNKPLFESKKRISYHNTRAHGVYDGAHKVLV